MISTFWLVPHKCRGRSAGADEIMGGLGRIQSEGLLASLPSPLAAAGLLGLWVPSAPGAMAPNLNFEVKKKKVPLTTDSHEQMRALTGSPVCSSMSQVQKQHLTSHPLRGLSDQQPQTQPGESEPLAREYQLRQILGARLAGRSGERCPGPTQGFHRAQDEPPGSPWLSGVQDTGGKKGNGGAASPPTLRQTCRLCLQPSLPGSWD